MEASVTQRKHTQLKACLNVYDLIFLGIGAIIGAGIFVLTGIAAATQAGPAIILSFVVAGFCCAFAALSYAELASCIGGCGSAYGYAYEGFGEFVAWLIGWDLILEYTIAISAVAIGWSGYFNNILMTFGIELPVSLLKSPLDGGIANLPAMLIILLISLLLTIGVKASARFNMVMVTVKLLIIGLFIIIAAKNINTAHWHPFMPFGWHGVMAGAAIVFFAYIGFDAVSTAAEEVIDPQRNLPIGIIVSLAVCTLLYIIVSGLLTGMVPYVDLNVTSPISAALLKLNYDFAASLIAIGAIAGLSTVILVLYYALTRIFFAMTRDGLLPTFFVEISPKTHTPLRIITTTGIIMALLSGLIPMSDLAELVNIGTLFAFALVCGGVIILRITKPDLKRPFKTPFNPLIPALGILFCVYLMISLPLITWLRFFIWMAIGLFIYFGYKKYRKVEVI